jgi:hypothetical protein
MFEWSYDQLNQIGEGIEGSDKIASAWGYSSLIAASFSDKIYPHER